MLLLTLNDVPQYPGPKEAGEYARVQQRKTAENCIGSGKHLVLLAPWTAKWRAVSLKAVEVNAVDTNPCRSNYARRLDLNL